MNLDSTALAYQSGFGNEFSSEALPGAPPVGQNSPQKAPYGLYAELPPAPPSPWLAARPGAPGCTASRRRPSIRRSAAWNDRSPVPNWMRRPQPPALGPAGTARAAHRLPRRPAAHGRQRARRQARRREHLPVPGQPLDGALLLRRRRRTAAGPAVGPPAPVHRTRRAAGRTAGDRGDPARDEVPRRAARRRGTRLYRREPRRAAAPARPRPDRQQWPGQSARLPGPGGALRRQPPAAQLVQKYLGELWACELDHSPLDVVAWHGNNVPASTTCAASTPSARSASTTRTRRSSPC